RGPRRRRASRPPRKRDRARRAGTDSASAASRRRAFRGTRMPPLPSRARRPRGRSSSRSEELDRLVVFVGHDALERQRLQRDGAAVPELRERQRATDPAVSVELELPRQTLERPAVRTGVKRADQPIRIDAHTVEAQIDRKSTRLNSSHVKNSYAVLCL